MSTSIQDQIPSSPIQSSSSTTNSTILDPLNICNTPTPHLGIEEMRRIFKIEQEQEDQQMNGKEPSS